MPLQWELLVGLVVAFQLLAALVELRVVVVEEASAETSRPSALLCSADVLPPALPLPPKPSPALPPLW